MFAQRRMQRELPGPQTEETGGGRRKESVEGEEILYKCAGDERKETNREGDRKRGKDSSSGVRWRQKKREKGDKSEEREK